MEKKLYDQYIDSDIKQYDEIKRLTTRQSEGYTTGCLLDYYYYIKNHCKWIAVDLIRHKELDADPKAIWSIEFVGQLKELHAHDHDTDAGDNDQSIFVLTILEKIKETKKFLKEVYQYYK